MRRRKEGEERRDEGLSDPSTYTSFHIYGHGITHRIHHDGGLGGVVKEFLYLLLRDVCIRMDLHSDVLEAQTDLLGELQDHLQIDIATDLVLKRVYLDPPVLKQDGRTLR